VEVEDQGSEFAVLRDDFSELPETRWARLGQPSLDLIDLDGGPALRLLGDEKYSDGIIYRTPLSLAQGITIEAEFRVEITNPIQQNFVLCLKDLDWEGTDLSVGIQAYDAEACVTYPAREFEKMDTTEFGVTVNPGRESVFRTRGPLTTDGWIHVALQVRADGLTSLVVNRQRVGVSPVALLVEDPEDWYLVLIGTTVGTEVYVRSLAAWQGERY
jgi:hypothetical protein